MKGVWFNMLINKYFSLVHLYFLNIGVSFLLENLHMVLSD